MEGLVSKTATIRFLKDGLYGGWDKDFAHGVQDKRVFRRRAGDSLEIDDGAINSPVLKQLVDAGCVEILKIDDVPGASPFDKSTLSERLDLAEGAQFQIDMLAPMGTAVLTHSRDPGGVDNPKRIVQVLRKFQPLGTNLAVGMTPYDPLNFSTFDANINDANLLNFWYNNSSFGPTGKWIGLDNTTPLTATHAKWYDYHASSIYQPTQYRIEGSANGTTWTTLADISSPTYAPSNTTTGHLVDLGGPQTYRYFRWFCVTGENLNFVIISEFELYNAPSPPIWSRPSGGVYRGEFTSDTQTSIINESGMTEDLLVNILFVDRV